MEELLRQAFQLGQQWVQDMNNEEEPINFNEWYASDKVQKQLQLGGVSNQRELLLAYEMWFRLVKFSNIMDLTDEQIIDKFLSQQ